MTIIQVNEEALMQAATIVVGAQATNAIIAMYQIIDRATADGYALGSNDAQIGIEERLNASFDAGWQYGEANITERLIDASDEGYIEGVADARARPQRADANVAAIINSLDQHALNSVDIDDGEAKINAAVEGASWSATFDESNVQDSGDAQPEDLDRNWCSVCCSYDCEQPI